MPLTTKQEAFCQAIVVGNTKSDAYRLAYNASHMKDKTVWKRSGELMADGAVAGRVAALRAENAKVVQASKEGWFAASLGLMEDPSTYPPSLEEAACISGFEVMEEFSGRREARPGSSDPMLQFVLHLEQDR